MSAPGAILITGCSSGIGKATARRLGVAGHVVYATARRPDTLTELERAGCRILRLDVTDDESMTAAVTAIENEHGAVGTLVNNAGYGLHGAAETTDIEAIRQQFETNFFGLVRLTQLVLPGMRASKKGRSSISARWAASSVSRAARTTTRPNTRWRPTATSSGSRSSRSAWTSPSWSRG